MADKKGLQLIGMLFGSIALIITATATLVVRNSIAQSADLMDAAIVQDAAER